MHTHKDTEQESQRDSGRMLRHFMINWLRALNRARSLRGKKGRESAARCITRGRGHCKCVYCHTHVIIMHFVLHNRKPASQPAKPFSFCAARQEFFINFIFFSPRLLLSYFSSLGLLDAPARGHLVHALTKNDTARVQKMTTKTQQFWMRQFSSAPLMHSHDSHTARIPRAPDWLCWSNILVNRPNCPVTTASHANSKVSLHLLTLISV